jgi:hypothetical protein
MTRPARKPAAEDDGPSCTGCRHWHEQTAPADEARWGNCHANPPTVVSDGEGAYCVVAWTEIPYACRHHAPRTH